MNTETFYLAAVSIASKFGFHAKYVTTSSFNFGGMVKHSAQVWTGSKHINSGQLGSTGEALKSFKSALVYSTETFSDKTEHIDL
jgi:hypothetical protein